MMSRLSGNNIITRETAPLTIGATMARLFYAPLEPNTTMSALVWMIRLSSATTRRRLVLGPPYFSTLGRESNGPRGERSTAKIKGTNGWSMIWTVVGCMIDGFSGFFWLQVVSGV